MDVLQKGHHLADNRIIEIHGHTGQSAATKIDQTHIL